jgi:hypothetical protein
MKELTKAFGALSSSFDSRDYKLVATAGDYPEAFELPLVPVKD